MVAGLGTITPASGSVSPAGAMIIGLIAGVICFFATQTVKRRFLIDDSLDVFPVHGVGGILGTLLVAVFANPALGVFGGWGFADGITTSWQQFQAQAMGVLATGLWAGGCTWLLLKLVGALTPLRVYPDEETEGLDIVLHEERGYSL